MSSETESVLLESLLGRDGGFSLFLSFIFGLTREPDPYQESPDLIGERMILIDPSTRTVFFLRSQSGLDAFLNGVIPGKQGRPPASKSAVEGMPRVEITEKEEGSCVICLEEWSDGDVAVEMPCKQMFHSKCVEEWLGTHGTCPVCRYEMPMEEEEVEKTAEILFRVAINGGGERSHAGGEGEGRRLTSK